MIIQIPVLNVNGENKRCMLRHMVVLPALIISYPYLNKQKMIKKKKKRTKKKYKQYSSLRQARSLNEKKKGKNTNHVPGDSFHAFEN